MCSVWERGSLGASRAILVAHRGGASVGSGDPVAGVRRLVELGVEMVEFDVRATADEVLVVYHAAAVDGVRLRDMSYTELARSGGSVPTLETFLEAAGGGIALNVELKEPGYERAALAAVLARVSADRVVVTSFHKAALSTVKKLAPKVATGLLVGRRAGWRTPAYLLRDVFPFGRLEDCHADFLAPHRHLLAIGLVGRAQRRGLRLLVWTVNDVAEVEQLRTEPAVLGIVTDSPELLAGG
jgi:glycerophosphoryl diester phosphodiesterase